MSEEIRREIGRLLRSVRHERGLGLEDVEALTGQIGWPVSRSRLSMVERGESDLRLSDLYSLSRSYGIPVTDLIAESLVAHAQRKPFPKEKTPEELFEEGKTRFRYGFPMEAAWAFEEAARRARDDASKRDFVFLCQVSAGHCYERAGAMELALKRVESVVDEAEEGSDVYLRALAKAAYVRGLIDSVGRSRIYLREIEAALRSRLDRQLRAVLLASKAALISFAGDMSKAAEVAVDSARRFRECGDHGMAAKLFAVGSLYFLESGAARRGLRTAQDALGLLAGLTNVEAALWAELAHSETLRACEELELAREKARKAAELAAKRGFEVEEYWAYGILARISAAHGKVSESKRWRQKQRAIGVGQHRIPPIVRRLQGRQT